MEFLSQQPGLTEGLEAYTTDCVWEWENREKKTTETVSVKLCAGSWKGPVQGRVPEV